MKRTIKFANPVYDESFWREHVNACEASEFNKSQYCKQQGLTYHRFLYWHNKFTAPSTVDNALIPVQMREQTTSVPPTKTLLATWVLRNGQSLNSYDVSVVTMILSQVQ